MSFSDQGSVSILSTGMYLPDRMVTAADIAVESSIEEWVIGEKFGIVIAAGVGYIWGQLVSDGVQLRRE